MILRHLTHYAAILLMLSIGLTNSSVYASTPSHSQTIAPMLDKVTPTIVNITVEKKIVSSDDELQTPPDNESQSKKHHPEDMIALGSGIIIEAKTGIIVTNAHVIDHAKNILVTLKDGRRYRAKAIGEDDGFDIAVIQIKAKHLTSLPLGDSDQLQVGNFVAAIGSPFGLNQTVTYGMVSALNRSHPKIEGFQSFIQTDAPINPGNSGGALVNMKGELIGINTALVGPGANVGIGFAIPSNMVNSVATQLIKYGKVKRGVLGVIAQNLTPSLAEAMHLSNSKGAIVSQVVPGSSAAKAGIEVKDILLTIDKKPMKSAEQIRNTLGMLRPNTKITLTVLRNGKPKTLTATVGDPDKMLKQPANPFLSGLNLRDFNELEADGHMLTGVLITNISEDSQAALAGLMPGDVITSANSQTVKNTTDIVNITKKNPKSLLVHIDRNNMSLFLVIEKA